RADDWTTYLALVRALAVRAHPHIPRWTNVAEAPMRRGSTDTCVAIYREALAACQQNPSEIRFSFLDLSLEAVETSYLDAFLSIDGKSWLEQTSPQVLNLLLEKTLNRAYEHGATAVERKLFRDRLVTL